MHLIRLGSAHGGRLPMQEENPAKKHNLLALFNVLKSGAFP
jgi:hypothetical protein